MERESHEVGRGRTDRQERAGMKRERFCLKWRSLSILRFCSQVVEEQGEREIDTSAAVMQSMYRSVVEKKELNLPFEIG